MQVAAIALVAASLLSAGAAVAADRVSDMDYLRASRCSGLATGLQAPDAPSLAAFVKQEGRQRDGIVSARSQTEFDRAKRQTRSVDSKERLTAELTSACSSFTTVGKDIAAGPTGVTATR